MLNLLFSNIGYLILVYFLICIVPCLRLKNNTSITMVAYLGAMEGAAWSASWLNSDGLLSIHFMLFMGLCVSHLLYGSLSGKFGDRLLFLAACIVVIDALSFGFNWIPFYQHSLLNVIFVVMCFITRKAGYNSLEKLKNWTDEDYGRSYKKTLARDLLIPFAREAKQI